MTRFRTAYRFTTATLGHTDLFDETAGKHVARFAEILSPAEAEQRLFALRRACLIKETT